MSALIVLVYVAEGIGWENCSSMINSEAQDFNFDA